MNRRCNGYHRSWIEVPNGPNRKSRQKGAILNGVIANSAASTALGRREGGLRQRHRVGAVIKPGSSSHSGRVKRRDVARDRAATACSTPIVERHPVPLAGGRGRRSSKSTF